MSFPVLLNIHGALGVVNGIPTKAQSSTVMRAAANYCAAQLGNPGARQSLGIIGTLQTECVAFQLSGVTATGLLFRHNGLGSASACLVPPQSSSNFRHDYADDGLLDLTTTHGQGLQSVNIWFTSNQSPSAEHYTRDAAREGAMPNGIPFRVMTTDERIHEAWQQYGGHLFQMARALQMSSQRLQAHMEALGLAIVKR